MLMLLQRYAFIFCCCWKVSSAAPPRGTCLRTHHYFREIGKRRREKASGNRIWHLFIHSATKPHRTNGVKFDRTGTSGCRIVNWLSSCASTVVLFAHVMSRATPNDELKGSFSVLRSRLRIKAVLDPCLNLVSTCLWTEGMCLISIAWTLLWCPGQKVDFYTYRFFLRLRQPRGSPSIRRRTSHRHRSQRCLRWSGYRQIRNSDLSLDL